MQVKIEAEISIEQALKFRKTLKEKLPPSLTIQMNCGDVSKALDWSNLQDNLEPVDKEIIVAVGLKKIQAKAMIKETHYYDDDDQSFDEMYHNFSDDDYIIDESGDPGEPEYY